MLIPEPFTPIVITAGICTNIASDIIKHHLSFMEDTLIGNILKRVGLIEPNFQERLQETIVKAFQLYFYTYPDYQLSGIISFFQDPIVGMIIGGHILNRQPINQIQLQQALTGYLGSDAITSIALERRKLNQSQIVPDFLKSYQQILNQELNVPQIAIMLAIVEQKEFILQYLEQLQLQLQTQSALSKIEWKKAIVDVIEMINDPSGYWDDLDLKFDSFNTATISFVLVTMNEEEAIDLISETVFANNSTDKAGLRRFRKLKKALQKDGIYKDLPACYGKNRSDWKPYTSKVQTTQDVIKQMVDFINKQHDGALETPIIVPEFVTDLFFSDELNLRLKAWHYLARSSCILIIDAISLFHPNILELLRDSGLISSERVAVLILSPLGFSSINTHQVIEEEISPKIPMASARFAQFFDKLCEFGLGDLRTLQRWLFAAVPETIKFVQKQQISTDGRKQMREMYPEPKHIHHAFYGKR